MPLTTLKNATAKITPTLKILVSALLLTALTACGGAVVGDGSSSQLSLSSQALSSSISSISSAAISSSAIASSLSSSAKSSSLSSAISSSLRSSSSLSSLGLSSSSVSSVNPLLTLQEQDAATCQIDGTIDSDNTGFTGSGFANANNAIGAGIVWHVRANAAGSYKLRLRYANGSAAVRDATLQINSAAPSTMSFAATSAWTDWQDSSINVNLSYGSNVIALRSVVTTGLANIDSLTLEGVDVTAGNCALAAIQVPDGALVVATALDFKAKTYSKGASFIKAYDWDFGDGKSGSGAQLSHSYSSAGNYTVALTTTDMNGEQYRTQQAVTLQQKIGPARVFIAGDSTVSTYSDTASPNDQAGWGQMLPQQYSKQVTIFNHAVGGRTARRFIDEGLLDGIWKDIKAGDYLLVQFGTNDGHKTATYELNGATIPYYLDPATDFKTYLKKYMDGAKARGVNLVFVTPPPRNSAYCTGGNGTGGHAQAMREFAAANNIPLVDLNQKSVAYLKAICPAPIPENFFLLRADGTVDGTHFQENGARIMSGMVADGIGEAKLPLDQYRL